MKFYEYYRFNRLCSFIVLILIITPYANAKKIKVDSSTKIIFKKYNAEHFMLRRYLQTVNNLTSMLLRSRHNLKLLPRIIVIDKQELGGDINIIQAGKSVNIYINSNLAQWKDNPRVNKKLISTLMFAKCDLRSPKQPLPDWLLTGLYAELKYKTSTQIFSPASYLPGVMALVRAGKTPELSTITNHPVTAQDGEAYLLYEEFCRFLLNISEKACRQDKEVFSEIVILAATGNYSQQEIFSSTIGRVVVKRYRHEKQLETNDKQFVNQWFQKRLQSKEADYFFPLSAQTIKKKFQQLFPIECELKMDNEKYKAVSITLTQLPKYWSKIKQPFKVQSILIDQLQAISKQAPTLISTPLYQLQKQLSELGNQAPATEQKILKTALNVYYSALERQIAIENYLENIEQRQNQTSDYYQRQMELIGRNKANPWQAMQRYLDKAEKKYLE